MDPVHNYLAESETEQAALLDKITATKLHLGSVLS